MMEMKQKITGDFPKRLKQLRVSKGWSQGQVAKKIGIESQRISKYERGVLYPTTELMLKLVSVFDVSLDYLLKEANGQETAKLKNRELLKRIEEMDKLPESKQNLLIAILDAFIKEHKFEELVKGG